MSVVVYDHPKDFPDKYVTRVWEAAQGVLTPSQDARLFASLASARRSIRRDHPGLIRLPRQSDDDPCIVETWI